MMQELPLGGNGKLISLKKVGGIVSTNGAEIAAFDAGSDRLFIVAGSLVEIQKVDTKGAITANGSLAFGFTPPAGTEVLPNSVAVKNGVVAVAYAVVNTITKAQQAGQVSFYNAATGAFLNSVEVGFLPDMLTFTPDGTKVLVANEGEPNSYGQATSFDPEGSVSVINITGGVATATVQNASFASFNSQIAALRTAGVRIFGPGATVAQDLEPEYIAVSPDGSTARVTLQENNAVAILDIATATITSITPLGVKNHSLAGNGLDASDRDLNGTLGTIKIQNQPVVGLYQPDAIASFSINGQAYYITANEGDARDYTGFAEELRVGAAGYVLDPTLFPNAATLKQNVNLGRLTVTRATGDTDGDGDFDRIEAFGARSFTIWDASGTQVFDSGDQIERITATQVPTLFNSDGAAATLDSRSDNKGPEPEGVAIGVINNRTYAFIGLERVGDVLVYDVSNPASPQFVQYLNTLEDVGVEGLSFISAADSPTGKPLLVTANEVSKTTALFEISLEIGKSVAGTSFLSQQTFATGLIPSGDAGKINGVDVPLGGLSGVTYDAVNNRYYAISDDRSQFGPARFYTFNLDPATLSTTGVSFTGVTALKDASGNTFALNSLDPEGIALSGNGTIFVSSEGEARPDLGASRVTNPFIKEFSLTTGQEIRSFTIPTKFLPKIQDTNGDGIVNAGDTQTAGIRNNLAFESLTITPDRQTLFTATENALFQDGAVATPAAGTSSRIVQFNVATGQAEKEFVYITDPVAIAPTPTTAFSTNGLVDLLAIDNRGTMLALERSFSTGAAGTGNTIKIYEISVQGAQDVSGLDSLNVLALPAGPRPVQKRLLLNLDDLKLSTGLDNVEGLAFGPKLADGRQSIVLVSDNNFSATQFTQVLTLSADLVPTADPVVETTPALLDDGSLPFSQRADADDPAVYVNGNDSAKSLVVTSVKNGGLRVYDLAGNLVQNINPSSPDIRYNNVDLQYGFTLGGQKIDIAVASDRNNDKLAIFKINPDGAGGNFLQNITDSNAAQIFQAAPFTGSFSPSTRSAYGLGLYRSPITNDYYAFTSRRQTGDIAQLKLVDKGNGSIGYELVRNFTIPSSTTAGATPQTEGIIVDQETGFLYIGQEDVGIWKFNAEPNSSSTGTLIERVKAEGGKNLTNDVEGLTIYYGKNGTGYLLASSQGDNTFAAYTREGNNTFVGRFGVGANGLIDGVQESDGAEVINVPLGAQFPNGLFVTQDGSNDPAAIVDGKNISSNFKFVPFENIANSFATPLTIDTTSYDPRNPVAQSKITNYDFTNLPKLGIASNGQDIFLGGFSGLFFQGLAANGNLKFVTNTDRGPNGEPTGANRPFLLPNFQPEIVSFELNRTTGKIDITKRTGLFRADGTTPLTGLPNLQAQANGLAYTDEIGVDLSGTVLPNDPFGADVEGIVVAPNGDYWLVDEYRPAIYHFDINGKLLDRFIPRGTAAATEPDSAPGTFGTEVLPEVYAQRRSNRGFEAVALEGDKLYAFIQSPIDNPDNAGDTASRTTRTLRILEFNTVSKAVTGEYVYLLDNISGAGTAKTDKLGDAVALGNGKFALVERDDLGTSASNKLIYQIDLAGATNINNSANFTLPAGKTIEQLTPAELTTARITPVSKNLIANAAQLGYTGVEKLEGLALVAPNTLALINDNDFNVGGGNVPERLGILELAKPLTVAQPAFPNGVASGDTTQNATVLWTRANTLGNVTFEYSTDANFGSIAGSKTAVVTNALQPVKVNVDGLAANTDYFYRVTDANGAKTNGKFSTAAALGTRTGLRFGAAGDWRGELAPYPSIGNADTANLKFFVELGDTIYGDVASPAVRNPDGSEKAQATTLADYRAKQAEVYSSRFGQNTLGDLRTSTSILATIDDHEVTNDFSGGKSLATANADTQALFGATTGLQNDSPLFENGLQAFQEYNPLQDLTYNTPGDARTDGERKLYRANTFGSDAATFILDTRSFRDGDLANVTNLADQAQVGKFLVDSFDPTRTFLGKQQLADLKQDLLKSQQDGVTWKFITVPEPIQNIGVLQAADRFEGYAAERTEILKFINDNKISNVVFVSADIHGTLVNNLTYQTAPGQAQIATSAFEITTGSVGYSQPFGQTVAQLGAALGVITPAQKAFYDAQNTAGKDAFIKGVVDAGLQPLGYDPLGLDKNLTQANGLINAKLLQGDYVATHVYGWTDFNIDQQTQKLTVTTYGIDSYTRAELEANPSAITSRQPRIVSQFEVAPTVADLELTQTVDKTNVEVGDRVTFTLTISNKGAVLANGIQVTDLLPSELSFIAATPGQGTYDNTTGRWTVGEIATNASTTLQITARVDRNGAVVNKAEVTALKQADSDSTVGNNNAAEDDQATISFSPQALVTGTSGIDDLAARITPGFDGVNDLLFTGSGNDTVDIALAGTATGNNRVDLGGGDDLIFIANADRVFGSNGNDELDASEAKDYRVSGGAGDDTFFLGSNGRALGGDGNDRFLVGGGGGNLLTGGAGVDQFLITTGDIPPVANSILDFQVGIDVIGIRGIGASATNIVLAQVGTDTSIAFGGQTLALLKGIQANSLTPGNTSQFTFA